MMPKSQLARDRAQTMHLKNIIVREERARLREKEYGTKF
jgi:hypothetical protein